MLLLKVILGSEANHSLGKMQLEVVSHSSSPLLECHVPDSVAHLVASGMFGGSKR